MPAHNTEDSKRVVERWHLEDVESTHRQFPDTFHLPSLEERRSLTVRRRVRLHFAFEQPLPDRCRAERITEKHDEQFRGSLENEPVYIRSLSAGSSVVFTVSHIAQVLILKTDPQWVDTSKKAVVSKRVFVARKVGFLYREKPHNDEDSGWVVWAGGENDAFTNDSTNYQTISLERLLEIDESIESLLNAEVGAVFERSLQSQGFQRVHDWKPTE